MDSKVKRQTILFGSRLYGGENGKARTVFSGRFVRLFSYTKAQCGVDILSFIVLVNTSLHLF